MASDTSVKGISWKTGARSLATQYGVDRIHPAVRAWMRTAPDGDWVLAVSGGADSVAMALLLWAHAPEMRSRMRILHVNHGLRGAEADRDADLVRQIGDALGVPVRVALLACNPAEAPPSEAILREARWWELLAEREQGLVAAYFLGHQVEDITETMLMRLGRGSGSRGLAAPRPLQTLVRQPPRLRPLMGWRREEIRHALREHGIPWREDSSNTSSTYTRNRVRQFVLPALCQSLEHDPVAGFARSRELLDEEDAALEHWLDSLAMDFSQPGISSEALRGLPRAVWRRAMARWLREGGAKADRLAREPREALLQAWHTANPWRGSAGEVMLVCDGKNLFIEQPQPLPTWQPVFLPAGMVLFLPDGAVLRWTVIPLDPVTRQRILRRAVEPLREAFLALETAADAPGLLRVRRWQAGDRFRPMGHPGTALLQDLFTNRKIPVTERNRIPVVSIDNDDGRILWVPGFGPDHFHRISEQTEWALWLTYEPPPAR